MDATPKTDPNSRCFRTDIYFHSHRYLAKSERRFRKRMDDSHKWWILSIAQIVAMILPIPGNLLNKRLGKAIIKIPILALTTIGNLFKLKGAYKKFIHTEHGEGHF